MIGLKLFEKLWSIPPLVWIKPIFLKPLRKIASKALDDAWQRELKRIDWPGTQEKEPVFREGSFDLWEELIIQLANEYEAGEITELEMAKFLMPAAYTFEFPKIKTQKPELLSIIHRIEDQSVKEKKSLHQMAALMISNLEQKLPEQLDPEKQKILLERMKKLNQEAELAEKQRRAVIAANPEMIEGMTADQYTSQKQAQNLKDKIIKKEQKVLRSKINHEQQVQKTFKQIGAEKQKALDELNKKLKGDSKSSTGTSI